MKNKLILFLLLIPSFLLAQEKEKFSLEECYTIATENYPLNKSKELNTTISQQKIENLKTVYRPVLSLDAKGTYQSEAMTVDMSFLPMPAGSEVPEFEAPLHNLSVDLNIQQTIWDGGYSKFKRITEQTELDVTNKSIELEIYKVKGQILESYFLILMLDKQEKVLKLSLETLSEQLKIVESAFKNGTTTEVNTIQLKAEIIKLEQKIIEIQSGKKTAYDILYHLMGIDQAQEKEIQTEEFQASTSTSINRHENELFALQKTKLSAYSEMLDVSKMPKLGAFARVGYGNPGLNFLSGDWNAYYIVGAQFSWKFWDWNETKRNKQIITVQQQLIDNQEETFNKNINTLTKKQTNTIEKLELLIIKDAELIKLNELIVENYNSQLKNGTITSSNYLVEWNKLTISKISKNIHEIELKKTKALLQLTMNK